MLREPALLKRWHKCRSRAEKKIQFPPGRKGMSDVSADSTRCTAQCRFVGAFSTSYTELRPSSPQHCHDTPTRSQCPTPPARGRGYYSTLSMHMHVTPVWNRMGRRETTTSAPREPAGRGPSATGPQVRPLPSHGPLCAEPSRRERALLQIPLLRAQHVLRASGSWESASSHCCSQKTITPSPLVIAWFHFSEIDALLAVCGLTEHCRRRVDAQAPSAAIIPSNSLARSCLMACAPSRVALVVRSLTGRARGSL